MATSSREAGLRDPVPNRGKMLKGRVIDITGSPCRMCMSAIYWSSIDAVDFAGSLEDACAIGFDDAFRYDDFMKLWEKRRIAIVPRFEDEIGLRLTRPGATRRTYNHTNPQPAEPDIAVRARQILAHAVYER